MFFLTASSEQSLIANLSRICESLQLDNVSNKASAFRQWLSRVENTDWLLIFDNADDLKSVKISQYIPETSWGHIVLTSRDQGAIGTVATDGTVLGRLEVGEATAVLFLKAGSLCPSAEDYEEAEVIVELLGCLPLAVAQGGAYIRSRRRTLTSYRRLYKDRQNDLLRFKPRWESTTIQCSPLGTSILNKSNAIRRKHPFCSCSSASLTRQTYLRRCLIVRARLKSDGAEQVKC